MMCVVRFGRFDYCNADVPSCRLVGPHRMTTIRRAPSSRSKLDLIVKQFVAELFVTATYNIQVATIHYMAYRKPT